MSSKDTRIRTSDQGHDTYISKYNKEVTVVVPCRDEEETIPDIVEAYDNLDVVADVIVVDNGSEDETAAVAKETGASLIQEPRIGKGYAILAGVKAATTDLIFCIDGDIGNPSKNWLQRAIDEYETGSDVVRAVPRTVQGKSTSNSLEPFSGEAASVNVASSSSSFLSVETASTSKDITSVNPASSCSIKASSLNANHNTRGSLDQAESLGSTSADHDSISVVGRIKPLLEQRYPSIEEMREPLGGIVLFPRSLYQQLTDYVGWDIDIGISIAVSTNEELEYDEFDIGKLVHAERSEEWYESMAEEIADSIRGE